MCAVLNRIAEFYHVEGPTEDEARLMSLDQPKLAAHESRYTSTKVLSAYMQYSAGQARQGDIHVNRTACRDSQKSSVGICPFDK
jgi:hypothetical protein